MKATRCTLFVVAAGLFGLTITAGRSLALFTIPLGIATTVWALRNKTPDGGSHRLLFAVITVFAVLSLAGPVHQTFGEPPRALFIVAGAVWLSLGVAWYATSAGPSTRKWIFASCLVTTAAIGAGHIIAAGSFGLDVLHLHKAAADAISTGANPYSAAVTVPSGAPAGPAFIVGYPYPPIVAVAYSASELILGDPRWLSLTTWMITLGVVGWPSRRGRRDWMSLGAMLALASIPGWPLVLTSGWTEPVTLVLFVMAAQWWRSTRGSGALIGVGIATKQYLVALLPVLAFARPLRDGRRLLWTLIMGAATLLPVLVWGISEFIEAAVRFHLEIPPRTDGTSLVGLLDLFGIPWSVPVWLMAVLVLGAAGTAGWWADSSESWIGVSAVVLAVAFLLSGQAFPNYWFLVAGMVLIALATTEEAVEVERDAQSTGPRRPGC